VSRAGFQSSQFGGAKNPRGGIARSAPQMRPKRLNRIIREKLKITNPRYTAYSLRHSFIDACKSAGIAEETRMKFVGHQLEGVHGIYGNPYVLPHESELIDTVRFDGIDFSCYAES